MVTFEQELCCNLSPLPHAHTHHQPLLCAVLQVEYVGGDIEQLYLAAESVRLLVHAGEHIPRAGPDETRVLAKAMAAHGEELRDTMVCVEVQKPVPACQRHGGTYVLWQVGHMGKSSATPWGV